MAEQNEKDAKKKTALEFINETIQWLIFGGILFKKGGGPPQMGPDGQPDVEVPKVPAWIMNAFHFLTKEDEEELVQVLDDFSEKSEDQDIFFEFRKRIVLENYDEDSLRLMIVNLNRDWINRKDAKKTNIPNSARIFLEQLVFLHPDYEAQKEMAIQKGFLEKVTTFKKLFMKAMAHKNRTLLVLILSPFVIASFIYQILNLFFG